MPRVHVDTAFTVIQMIRAAETLHGVAAESILRRAGVPASRVANPLLPLPVPEGSRILAAALALTGDPLLGLKAGRMSQLRRSFGLAGVFLTHAPDARLAMEKSIMVQNRTGNAVATSLEEQDGTTSLRTRRRVDRSAYAEQVLDFHMGVGVTSSELYSDPRSHAHAVEVPPEWLERVGKDAYEQVIGRPTIAAAQHGLCYRTEGLRAALPVDADVFEVLAPEVEGVLSLLPEVQTLRDVVGAAIEQRLEHDGARPNLGAVARMLAMAPRTLQARLREEDTSLRALLDEARARLAAKWLARGLSQAEVAARLGFSESAAFRRAWRRWKPS